MAPMKLPGVIARLFFSVSLLAGALAAEAAEYSRRENFVPPELGARPRAGNKPFLFAEFLFKYGMFQNYLHQWIDRPLFCNRALRPERMAYETLPSLAVHAAQLRKCGLDGFAVFANLKFGKSQMVSQIDDWLVQGGFNDLRVLPIISYGESVDRYGPNFDAFKTAISAARASPRFPRLNGKVLVHTYNYRLFSREEHRRLNARLVETLGNDDFILCGQLNAGLQRKLERAYRAAGRLTTAQMQELEAEVRSVLDVAGGIHLNPLTQEREVEGPYCSHYSTKFFDEVLGPLVRRILAESAYADRVLGFYVFQGYINPFSGHCHAEDGTDTLRRCLHCALKYNPDYLVFFEWNEVNENTMFQPTVLNGRAIGRLIRWYSRFMHGLEADVYPGDDTNTPNLTLSHRSTVKAGEVLDFEILNIPDGVRQGLVRGQLKLLNPQGEQVMSFPEEIFDETRLGAISYRMSTAELKGGDVLVPVLTVADKTYTGFHPIRISPTVAWNYKSLRQSLRDQLLPVRAETSVQSPLPGRYAYSVAAEFGEKLASMELIANENEQDAAGQAAEYDRASNEVVRIAFTAPPKHGVRGAGIKVKVEGAHSCRFHNVWMANVDPGVIRADKDGTGFSVRALIWSEPLAFYLEVPKSMASNAVLAVKVDTPAREGTPLRLPLSTVLAKGICSGVFNDDGARVEATRFPRLADLPPLLGQTTCRWQGETASDVHAPAFHFRAISENGRIWRSPPIRAEALPAAMAKYPAYDEFAYRVMTATAPAALIPQIDYAFDPATGASLANTWERSFDAQLGGGFSSGQAFSSSIQPPPGRRDPQWVQTDGAWALYFDGTNDYVSLPKEAFPQAAFTLTMEIKPRLSGVKQMVLFRHFDRVRGSLSLFIREGRLFATWGDRELTREPQFETCLEVRSDEWNEIVVTYDFREFVFRVNGVERRFPWTGRAWCFKPAIFGGHDKIELSGSREAPGYFRGWLRKLSIRHNSL